MSKYIINVPKAKTFTKSMAAPFLAALAAYGFNVGIPGFVLLFRVASGKIRKLLGRSLKVEKGEKVGVLTKVMYLSPSKEAGINTCPFASNGCAASCLGHSTGHLQFARAKATRVLKTLLWALFPEFFLTNLVREIINHAKNAKKKGMKAAVRLNGSSDIFWENYLDIDGLNRDYQLEFYDYTKAPVKRVQRAGFPKSYHLTFSVSEKPFSLVGAKHWLNAGYTIAVVVAGSTIKVEDAQAVSATILERGWYSVAGSKYPVLDMDETDIRFDDPPGHVGVLYAKGSKALRDTSGFVQRHA